MLTCCALAKALRNHQPNRRFQLVVLPAFAQFQIVLGNPPNFHLAHHLQLACSRSDNDTRDSSHRITGTRLVITDDFVDLGRFADGIHMLANVLNEATLDGSLISAGYMFLEDGLQLCFGPGR